MHQRGYKIVDVGESFHRFCNLQLRFFSDFQLYSENGQLAVDRVLRYESLQSDFNTLMAERMAERGTTDVSLGDRRWNSGIRKEYDIGVFYGKNFDNANVDIVANVFAAEISEFGYEFPTKESVRPSSA
ncbi:hypothetical protein RUA4292_02081 [Ruegeria atlantica]|uniref:Uncharacterized protein n=2 Tax=Ruegeria atlantica TaxID=81569 RepID=A0A0P1EEH7_9RHOB|nr:hypothetical protein RUA4292_02081 [Ruegeria atlantica]